MHNGHALSYLDAWYLIWKRGSRPVGQSSFHCLSSSEKIATSLERFNSSWMETCRQSGQMKPPLPTNWNSWVCANWPVPGWGRGMFMPLHKKMQISGVCCATQTRVWTKTYKLQNYGPIATGISKYRTTAPNLLHHWGTLYNRDLLTLNSTLNPV